jgi:anti-anti-sigma factor
LNFSLTITTTPRSASVRVGGDLDYETIDELVDATSQLVAQQVGLTDLHLDFSGLTFLDSAALSGLLLLHRRTSQAGMGLHLDNRPAFVDRVLHVTGVVGHFVSSHSDAQTANSTSSGSRVR